MLPFVSVSAPTLRSPTFLKEPPLTYRLFANSVEIAEESISSRPSLARTLLKWLVMPVS